MERLRRERERKKKETKVKGGGEKGRNRIGRVCVIGFRGIDAPAVITAF